MPFINMFYAKNKIYNYMIDELYKDTLKNLYLL